MIESAYSRTVEDTARALGTDPRGGLTGDQVIAARERWGPNELTQAPPVAWWRKFLAQFNNLIIGILIVAALISGAMGEWTDTAAILAIVLLNAILGFSQEERAEQALAALEQMTSPMAKVTREGSLQLVAARDLVPGDLITLEAGDNVPADTRLTGCFGLRIQEAALTGESVPVNKDAAGLLPARTGIGDRRNIAHMGTVIAAGRAEGLVVATGMDTELGRIAGMLQHADREPTPLQRRLSELGRIIAGISLLLVAIIFSMQIGRGEPMAEAFLIAVSLAVAAVPEGLPAVVTIALALGLQRMVRRNALIRNLASVETLGSVTVICSDKTGTLTRNEMTVREIVAGGKQYRVTGEGYRPRGEFLLRRGATELAEDPRDGGDLSVLLRVAASCNDAHVTPRAGSEDWQVIGDPTEGALLVAALKGGIDSGRSPGDPPAFVIPFDSDRKAMSVVLRRPDGGSVMYTKGAPEVILRKCDRELRGGVVAPLTEDGVKSALQANEDMASRALRVLGLAYRELPGDSREPYEESGLVFVGITGMIDPPRETVKTAVASCREAGIRPVMITGDHPGTAAAIARELGILGPSDRVVTGTELDGIPDEDLRDRIRSIGVYARVSAEHKLRVVRAWKSRGDVVAMTGDGVNDAPAVKSANIGIAMGITGTDVTKQASDLVLMDDNFASIVNAVEEGRGIYDNIQKFLHYLLASNTSEVLFMFFAALLGWPAPLLPVQILWINLVTDSLPALGLGMEPPEPDVMKRTPRPLEESVITSGRGLLMLAHGSLMALVALIGFAAIYRGNPASLAHARTVAFCVMAYSQLFFSISCRSRHYTMPQLGFWSNPALVVAILISGLLQFSVVLLPPLRPYLETATHPLTEWALVFVLALIPVTVVEVVKLLTHGSHGIRGVVPGSRIKHGEVV